MGVCDLCTHIAGDPVLAGLASGAAAAFEVRQLEAILDSLQPVAARGHRPFIGNPGRKHGNQA
jgi:hypothetical protein